MVQQLKISSSIFYQNMSLVWRFSLLGKATTNLQLMAPPTTSPYGPVTKDICHNFKVATNVSQAKEYTVPGYS